MFAFCLSDGPENLWNMLNFLNSLNQLNLFENSVLLTNLRHIILL